MSTEPADTPPAEGSTPTARSERGGPNTGDRGGAGRGPMIFGLGLTGFFVALVVIAALVALAIALS